MPSKNSLKQYVQDGYYHVYNRGNDKRLIFVDDQDYRVFLRLLKISLTIREELDYEEFIRIVNRAESVELIAYCLMPNHFHLILKQLKETGMADFMRSVMTAYVSYFNKKYERTGSLFQGRYKAILIEKDEYLTHLTRYIHMNPAELSSKIEEYPYSSYKYYLNSNYPKWLRPQFILSLFSDNPAEYRKFVEDKKVDELFLSDDFKLE